MSTTIIDPRPPMRAGDAEPRRAVLASSFEAAWQTIGNAYEQLTSGIAPGNGGRTVPLPHDHQASAQGAFVAQAQCRWQGLSLVGDFTSRATAFPLGLPYLYVWAGLIEVYTVQEMALIIIGNTGNGAGATRPGSVAQALVLEVNGFSHPFEFRVSNDPETWVLSANFIIPAGTNTASLQIDLLNPEGETWSVIGAEVWCNSNNQMVTPP